MAQFVIEFGAKQVRPVADAIQAILAQPYRIQVDRACKGLSYDNTDKKFDDIVDDLALGHATSAIIRCDDPRIRYGLITGSQVHPALALWMGTIEVCAEDWAFVWERLLIQAGLRFVAVCFEEGVEFADGQMSADAFPWTASELLVGAVRADEQLNWTIGERVAK